MNNILYGIVDMAKERTEQVLSAAMPAAVWSIVKILQPVGGECLLVGGSVVDAYLGNSPKDWDIEVYGLTLSQLVSTLTDNGIDCDLVGQAFGIIKVNHLGEDLDISVPRIENRCGVGHKGFSVELDSTLTPRQAAKRRDLTINSLAYDIVKGEIVDPFGGMDDLQKGLLRATDPETFVEDPLRVMRLMQLLPRKGKMVDPATVELCRSISGTFQELAPERVFEEFRKLLMKAQKPSQGLRFLADADWLRHFPALNNMVGCEQHPEWHPEGDVFEHTCMVLDAAASHVENIPADWKLGFMFAAMLHDVGKVETTTSDLTSHGHDMAGGPVAREFMESLKAPNALTEQVVALVENHMQPGNLTRGGAGLGAWKRLHNKVRLDILAWMSQSDFNGCGGKETAESGAKVKALEMMEVIGTDPVAPILQGRHLMAAGFKPGKSFGVMLRKAYDHQLDTGCEDIQELVKVATR